MLPGPLLVLEAIIADARSGALFFHLGATLARVLLAFTLAMALGTVVGIVMGRSRLADRLADPWLLVLLNLPALVVIVLAYIWAGLTEAAAIAAVAVNKLPNTAVTVREGSLTFTTWVALSSSLALTWRSTLSVNSARSVPQLNPDGRWWLLRRRRQRVSADQKGSHQRCSCQRSPSLAAHVSPHFGPPWCRGLGPSLPMRRGYGAGLTARGSKTAVHAR